jgi:hypothetical protein
MPGQPGCGAAVWRRAPLTPGSWLVRVGPASRPTAAQAMTNLSNDYTDLVESQTGAAELPDMTTVQADGAAFDRACGG